jgi:HSP20 family protein
VEPKHKDDPPGLKRIHTEVDKMFLELLRGERVPRYGATAFRPNADVYFDGNKNAVVVKLELPGIDPEAVNLEVDDKVLRVSGIRSDERHPDVVYQQMEITYGRFERAVMLPPEVDAAEASASYAGGFLEIILPIRPRAASKRITINLKDECEGEEQS